MAPLQQLNESTIFSLKRPNKPINKLLNLFYFSLWEIDKFFFEYS